MKDALWGSIGALAVVLLLWFLSQWAVIPLTKGDVVETAIAAALVLLVTFLIALRRKS